MNKQDLLLEKRRLENEISKYKNLQLAKKAMLEAEKKLEEINQKLKEIEK